MNNTICLNGRIQRAAPIDIFQRGTHRLIDITGRVIAILRSFTVNLFLFEGQFVTVCGIFEGNIEGVPSILVTSIFNQNPPNCPPNCQPNCPPNCSPNCSPNCPCPNQNCANDQDCCNNEHSHTSNNLLCSHCSTDFNCKHGKHRKSRTHKKHHKKH